MTTASTGRGLRLSEDDVVERMKGRGGAQGGEAARASAVRIAQQHASSVEALHRALSINERTNELADDAASELRTQGETLSRANDMVTITLENLRAGKVTIRDIKRAVMREKFIKGAIISGLLLAIFVIIYVKWLRHRGGGG